MLYRRKMPTQMCALISFAVLIYLLFHKGYSFSTDTWGSFYAIVVKNADSDGMSRFAAFHGYSPFGRVTDNGLSVSNKATQLSITGKCQDHTIQTIPWPHEVETQSINSHVTAITQICRVIDSGRNESYLEDKTVTESTTASTLEPTTPVNCSILSPPANGSVSYPTGILKGGFGIYSCDDPCYGLGGGTNVRTCQSDGQWNGTEPSCSLVDEEYTIGFRNSCYMFDSVSRISWFDAKETCANKSSKLIEIESEEEQMFIEGHLNSSVRFWWIGGQDLDLEFIFEWDSTGLKRPDWLYDNFYRNEPNFLTLEHCMVLWRDKGYQWGNDRCGIPRLHAYICEMET